MFHQKRRCLTSGASAIYPPGRTEPEKVILAEEAKRIKNDNVNSAFSRPVFVSGLSMAVWKFVVC